MRRFFANWAAHNCADMDYLTREQWQLAQSLLNVPGRLETGLYRSFYNNNYINIVVVVKYLRLSALLLL